MDSLTIQEAAQTTGWSPRMLRYIETIGLVRAGRSDSGYRLYGPAELQRLRTLRELLSEQEIALGEMGFALRLRTDPAVRAAVEDWLSTPAHRPEHVPASEWLAFEQQKHQRLVAFTDAPATDKESA